MSAQIRSRHVPILPVAAIVGNGTPYDLVFPTGRRGTVPYPAILQVRIPVDGVDDVMACSIRASTGCTGAQFRSRGVLTDREPATATLLVPCRGSDTRRSIADYRLKESKRDRAFLPARRRCRR